ncbi:MAG: hypothetical protein ACI9U2_004291, partial [Bradymonadia bacterium]
MGRVALSFRGPIQEPTMPRRLRYVPDDETTFEFT